MLEIDIPVIDPIQHEPKIFVGLTARQCMCLIPGAALSGGTYWLLSNVFPDIAFYGALFFAVLTALFGWYKPYNMKFEDYLKLLYYNNFVSNPKRIYKTDTASDEKLLTIKEREALEKKQQEAELKQKKSAKSKSKKTAKEDA